MPNRERRPKRRTALRLTVLLTLVSTMVIGAGVPVYVLPQVDPLRRADAVFVLGGPGYDRYMLGLELGSQGWAPTVVISNPNGSRDPWLTQYCATQPADMDLYCFIPDPPTTRGEGEELRRLAAEHSWRTVIVVTFRPHISRARLMLQRCFSGELVMVASPADLSAVVWISEYALQTAGYVRAALRPGC